MKPFNLQVVLLLGGILLFALGFQIFVGYSVENFESDQAPPTDLGNVLAAQGLKRKMPSA